MVRVVLVAVASIVAFAGWGDRSSTSTVDLAGDDLLVVNVAGPVTVRSDAAVTSPTATIDESWLWGRPEVATSLEGGRSVLRVRCAGLGPCRAAVEITVRPGAEVVVIAEDDVTVTRFDGSLAVLAADGTVALGPVSGSARVVSGGRIDGFGLTATALDVSSTGDVSLTFDVAPDSLVLAGDDVDVAVPEGDYLVAATAGGRVVNDLDSDDGADARLVLDAAGDLVLRLAEDR